MIFYFYKKFSKISFDYVKVLNSSNDFIVYENFLKSITNLIFQVPRVYVKLQYNFKNNMLDKIEFESIIRIIDEPDSDSRKIENLNEALINGSNKKILKAIIGSCDSVDDILFHYHFLKYNEIMFKAFGSFKKNDIYKIFKNFVAVYNLKLHEKFLESFSLFLHATCNHCRPKFEISTQLKTFADDINQLCIRLGVSSFGFIYLPSLDCDKSSEYSDTSAGKSKFFLHPKNPSKCRYNNALKRRNLSRVVLTVQ